MKLAWLIERAQGFRLDHVHRHRYWLHYGDIPERVDAAMSLGRHTRRAELAVPALIGALDDPSRRVVGEAVTSLGTLGKSAATALPRIEALANHADPQIAARARAACRQLRPH